MRILKSLGLALLASMGAAIVVAILAALVNMYASGHGIELPDFSIDYRPYVALSLADVIILVVSFIVFGLVFIKTFKAQGL